jgi:hypothetical protein
MAITYPMRQLFIEWATDLEAPDPEGVADQLLDEFRNIEANEETTVPVVARLRELSRA